MGHLRARRALLGPGLPRWRGGVVPLDSHGASVRILRRPRLLRGDGPPTPMEHDPPFALHGIRGAISGEHRCPIRLQCSFQRALYLPPLLKRTVEVHAQPRHVQPGGWRTRRGLPRPDCDWRHRGACSRSHTLRVPDEVRLHGGCSLHLCHADAFPCLRYDLRHLAVEVLDVQHNLRCARGPAFQLHSRHEYTDDRRGQAQEVYVLARRLRFCCCRCTWTSSISSYTSYPSWASHRRAPEGDLADFLPPSLN